MAGSAPAASSASTALIFPLCAARCSAVTPCPCSGPPKVALRLGSAPRPAPRPAEGRLAAGIRSELDEPPDRRDAPARRGPDQRRPAVGIAVGVGAELDERAEHVDAVALGGPHERLVEDLLRIVGRLPDREAGVRPVEAARRTGGLDQGPVVANELP